MKHIDARISVVKVVVDGIMKVAVYIHELAVVEVIIDGVIKAAIYVHEPNTLRLISSHIADPIEGLSFKTRKTRVYDFRLE